MERLNEGYVVIYQGLSVMGSIDKVSFFTILLCPLFMVNCTILVYSLFLILGKGIKWLLSYRNKSSLYLGIRLILELFLMCYFMYRITCFVVTHVDSLCLMAFFLGYVITPLPIEISFSKLFFSILSYVRSKIELVKGVSEIEKGGMEDVIWCDQDQSYYHWKGNKWIKISILEAQRLIFNVLKAQGHKPGSVQINSVDKMGCNDRNLLFFKDCVWDIKMRIKLDHSSSYLNTFVLPYEALDFKLDAVDPIEISNIEYWLNSVSGGNSKKRELLIGFLYLVLIGYGDHQVFMEIAGKGRSGKTTFQNLAIALVGLDNIYSTNLNTLQNNRFEVANILHKKLVVLPDQPHWAGSLDTIKAMTGQDPLRFEQKGIQGGSPFIFEGLVLITENQPFISADISTGLSRRRLLVAFNTLDPSIKGTLLKFDPRTSLPIGSFSKELSPFINYLLLLDSSILHSQFEHATVYFSDVIRQSSSELLFTPNSLEGFIEEHIVFCKGSVLPMTTRSTLSETERNEHFSSVSIYAFYLQYCREMGIKPVGLSRFGAAFKDNLEQGLNSSILHVVVNNFSNFDEIASAQYIKNKTHRYWQNIAFKLSTDNGDILVARFRRPNFQSTDHFETFPVWNHTNAPTFNGTRLEPVSNFKS